jgi:hypothetical protein
MKLRLSVPSSRPLSLLVTILAGCATGVLWPVNGFLLKFVLGFSEALLAILVVAGVVWCASTFYVLACRPLVKLFLFKSKKRRPTVVSPVPAPLTPSPEVSSTAAAKIARDDVSTGRWVGIAVLTGAAALWLILVGWASSAQHPFIVFSGWAAAGCACTGFALKVIAGAFDNDDVGTVGILVLMFWAIFTMLVLVGLFASM